MSKKFRADQLAHERGLAESREQAKRLIMAGQVLLETAHGPEPVVKPGQPLPLDALLSLKTPQRFVSRGGEKLLTAIEAFALDFAGKVCLDAGASTGGFTDCMLQHGAARVYAADVGHGQLHEKLTADSRVVNLERINLRHAPPNLLPEQVDCISVDVSFISLVHILPACLQFLKTRGELVALVKPQFELGPGRTVKGVVRREEDRQEAVDTVAAFVTAQLGLTLVGVVPSKILGPKGNQEYVSYFTR
ncbi:TlyA family RNA methyltransferase [Megalodesulfovibrio gigas]|uniref:Putative hemolysin A n=1 Tax=Megalodesulfovibrio gigas (strain ATCC 19364 / DSM 1382 / NCIMB 9332 / VKM B-1759) TaxID=1121448 RepID=T2G7R1_MEGG1|nr:TlyA family RNA methyltransferase [Megalodesulfovibrio gigas]AGW12605.1 putative hemolysin A [Megalodesulfovibrio gigas DSM 1382 = ATCC 19364]